MNLLEPLPSRPCTECQAGQMRRREITYFTWLGDELITVPNFPAWICDVCGKREYDTRAISQLTLFLSPNAGRPSAPKAYPPRKPLGSKGQRPSPD